MKHIRSPRGELRFETLQMLSCLLFLGIAALLMCPAALTGSLPDLAVISAVFAAVLLLDAAYLLLTDRLSPLCTVVLTAAALGYAFCLLRAGGLYPLWLLLLPVCVLPLSGLRRGLPLCLAVLALLPCCLPQDETFRVLPALYGLLCLAGVLVERLYTYNISRHVQQRSTLETLSRTDALTGICNRWWYNEQLKNRSGRPEYRRRYVLLLIDLDHFKAINDTYGHLCGDQVLIDTARIIESAFQKDGIVCRWGGDEFLCQVRASSPEQALSMAEDIRKAIADTVFPAPNGGTMTLTVSIGAVFVPNPQDIYSIELFSIADQALYEAKNGGRNRVVFRVTRTSDTEDGEAG